MTKISRSYLREVDIIEIFLTNLRKKFILILMNLSGNIAKASYLFNDRLRHAHSVLFSSERNETKTLRFLL